MQLTLFMIVNSISSRYSLTMIKIPAHHGSTIIGTHKPVSVYPFMLQNALATRFVLCFVYSKHTQTHYTFIKINDKQMVQPTASEIEADCGTINIQRF